MGNKIKLDWIDIAKGIAILLVVMGHSFPDAAVEGGVKNVYLHFLHDVIYSFHMPLMFFISGMLCGRILKLEDFSGRVGYVKDRAFRLLVPYFCVAIFYLPFKLALAQFVNKPYNIVDLWQIFVGVNPDGGLWFLFVLFCAQAIMGLVITKENLKHIIVACLLIALLVIATDIHFYKITSIPNALFFTVLGLMFSSSSHYGKEKMGVVPMIIMLILFGICVYIRVETQSQYFKLLSGFFGAFSVVGISKWLSSLKGKIIEFFKLLGQYTMDIYIFHGILMVVVRIAFYSILKWDYYVCCLIMLLVGLLLPIFISKQ